MQLIIVLFSFHWLRIFFFPIYKLKLSHKCSTKKTKQTTPTHIFVVIWFWHRLKWLQKKIRRNPPRNVSMRSDWIQTVIVLVTQRRDIIIWIFFHPLNLSLSLSFSLTFSLSIPVFNMSCLWYIQSPFSPIIAFLVSMSQTVNRPVFVTYVLFFVGMITNEFSWQNLHTTIFMQHPKTFLIQESFCYPNTVLLVIFYLFFFWNESFELFVSFFPNRFLFSNSICQRPFFIVDSFFEWKIPTVFTFHHTVYSNPIHISCLFFYTWKEK